MSSHAIDLTQSPSRASRRRRVRGKQQEAVEVDDGCEEGCYKDGVLIIRIIRRKTSRLRAEALGLPHGTYKRMLLFGLPFALFNILWWLSAIDSE